MSGKGKSGGEGKDVTPNSWTEWVCGENDSLIPPSWRGPRDITDPTWAQPEAMSRGDMKQAMTMHLEELHRELQMRQDQVDHQPVGHTNDDVDQLFSLTTHLEVLHGELGMRQDQVAGLKWWKRWEPGEERNPVPPAWRDWPLSDAAKSEIGKHLHLLHVHGEIEIAKYRYNQLRAV